MANIKIKAKNLLRCYRRRRMINYINSERAFQKFVIDILVSDELNLFVCTDNEIAVNMPTDKFIRLLNDLKLCRQQAAPDGITLPQKPFFLEGLMSEFDNPVE